MGLVVSMLSNVRGRLLHQNDESIQPIDIVLNDNNTASIKMRTMKGYKTVTIDVSPELIEAITDQNPTRLYNVIIDINSELQDPIMVNEFISCYTVKTKYTVRRIQFMDNNDIYNRCQNENIVRISGTVVDIERVARSDAYYLDTAVKLDSFPEFLIMKDERVKIGNKYEFYVSVNKPDVKSIWMRLMDSDDGPVIETRNIVHKYKDM